MKILVVNRLFDGVSGGVERMTIALMNEMSNRGHQVHLLSWDQANANTRYPLSDKVVWYRLNMGDARKKAGFWLRLKRQLAIRKLISSLHPDVVIAFQHGPFFTISTSLLGLGIPVVAAERSAPDRFEHVRAKKWKSIIFQSFRLADCITIQSPDFISGYPAYLRERILCIPNPVRPARAMAEPGMNPGTKQLLCVGRLSYPKNQAVLIKAFSKLANALPDWQLVLVGDGEDEFDLKQLATSTGLIDRVSFVSATTDIERFYIYSHLFCLPSYWEGFPNALAEAMAHGLPAVGFADCAGVRQLIMHGKSGFLAEGNGSVESLAAALLPLMQDAVLRRRMGAEAIVSMTAYAPEAIFNQWEAGLQKLVHHG